MQGTTVFSDPCLDFDGIKSMIQTIDGSYQEIKKHAPHVVEDVDFSELLERVAVASKIIDAAEACHCSEEALGQVLHILDENFFTAAHRFVEKMRSKATKKKTTFN